MSNPWLNAKPGDPTDVRTARYLAAQAQSNQALRGVAAGVAGLIDMCGPPVWDQHSWDLFKQATGKEPFSASELPPSFEDCPRWAYERMGLRPPLMAQ